MAFYFVLEQGGGSLRQPSEPLELTNQRRRQVLHPRDMAGEFRE